MKDTALVQHLRHLEVDYDVRCWVIEALLVPEECRI